METQMDILIECKKVFDTEIAQLRNVRESLDDSIVDIVYQIYNCKGKTVVCGIGKAGHVARKIAATLSSLGIASFFLHPTEALHGDLGCLSKNDIVLLISKSGNSKEVLELFPTFKLIGLTTIAITSNPDSELAIYSDCVLCTPKIQEACSLNLAPTSSTTVQMVLGDALAIAVSMLSAFKKENFALYHPAGSLGKKLLIRVEEIMHSGTSMPIVHNGSLVKDALVVISEKRLGSVIVVDKNNKLCGLITDGDIRRAFEKSIDIYECTVDMIMTSNPIYIKKDILAVDALKKMIANQKNISVLPVIDDFNKPEGIICNHDIIRNGIIL